MKSGQSEIPSLKSQILAAKAMLDAARRLSDELRIDLAEATLNNLLDRYHAYHALQTNNRREGT